MTIINMGVLTSSLHESLNQYTSNSVNKSHNAVILICKVNFNPQYTSVFPLVIIIHLIFTNLQYLTTAYYYLTTVTIGHLDSCFTKYK